MAIIPRNKEQTRLSVGSPVGIGSGDFAGTPGRTLEGFGDALAKVGLSLYQADQRISIEEGSSEINTTLESAREYARKNSKVDGSDYQEKFKEYSDPRIEEIKSRRSGFDPKVSRELESYSKKAMYNADVDSMITAAKMNEQHQYERIDGIQNQAADRIRESGNPEVISNEIVSHNQLIDDLLKQGSIPAGNAAKLRKSFLEKGSKQLIEGLENKQNYRQALNLLQANQESPDLYMNLPPDEAQKMGLIDSREADSLAQKGESYQVPVMTKDGKHQLTPQEAMLMGGMDPREKASAIDRLTSKIKAKSAMKLSDLNAGVSGFTQLAMAGAPINDKQVAELKRQINNNEALTPFARVRLMDEVNTAQAVNKQLQIAATTPRGQAGNVIEGLDKTIKMYAHEAAVRDPKMAMGATDFAVQANREDAKRKFATSLENLYQVQDKDPAAFHLNTDTEINKLKAMSADADTNPEARKYLERYNDAVLNKSNYLGSKAAILTKAEASNHGKILQALPSSEDANNYINQMQAMYGPKHFSKAMTEVIASNPQALGKYQAVIHAEPGLREDLVDGIRNEGAIAKEFKKGGQYEGVNSLVEASVKSQFSQFRSTFVSGVNDSGNLKTIQNLESAAMLQAKRDIVRSGKDPEAAAKDAYATIVGSQYATVSGNNGSKLIIPRQVGGYNIGPKQEQHFAHYADYYTRAENLAKLNIAVPKNAVDTESDSYYKRLAPNLRWVTNENQSGMRLMETVNGKIEPVYDRYGRKVEKSYEDVYLNPGKSFLEDQKSFFQKMFGG